MNNPEKEITDKQAAFLEALLGEARGNIRAVMNIAGYSKMTKTSKVVSSLREEIIERAGLMLTMSAPKAALGIVDVVDDPLSMDGRNTISAARAIDLYKADTGKRKTCSKKSPAQAVGRTSANAPLANGKMKFSES
jgi:hypothetical protein